MEHNTKVRVGEGREKKEVYTVKNGVLRYTFAMVFWDTFIYVGVT